MKKKTYQGIVVSALLLLVGVMQVTAQQTSLQKRALPVEKYRQAVSQSILANDPKYQITKQYQELATKETALKQQLTKSVESGQQDLKLQKKAMNYLDQGDRMQCVMTEIKQMRARGIATATILQTIQQRLALHKSTAVGNIAGTVTVAGMVPPGDVMVLAFDIYGYLAAADTSDFFDGSYQLSGLPVGDYYVVTQSSYVDEFYNNVLLNHFKNWRQAAKVAVTANITAANKNFDLEMGATISGVVTESISNTPMYYSVVFIEVYSTIDPSEPILNMIQFTDMFGAYSFMINQTGDFKIYAETYGYQGEFYNNQPDWAHATPVHISTPSDVVSDINFSLTAGQTVPTTDEGSMITGSIISETDSSYLQFVLVFAFDAADTSVNGFGLQFMDSYEISGLKAGTYIVMATDLLQGYNREFYFESSSPASATPVSVMEHDTISNINFTLGLGGSISGVVSNNQSQPLIDVPVVALQGDLANIDKFFTNIDLGFAMTDTLGHYKITGISSGDYYVCTLSIASDYSGIYLDEWYNNIRSLLKFKQATKVAVTEPNETAGINFQLEKGGAIAGKITAASGGAPVHDVLAVVAIDTTDGLPQIAPFNYKDGNDGSYVVSMLAPGSYILFALVDPSRDGMYISEFYNGVTTLANATVVNVVNADTTKNINFTLEKGGMVQGFVYLESQYPAGKDTLNNFPVVLYDVNTGNFGGAATIQFSGGYRIPGIAAGQYKVAAIPVRAPYAVTYYGGGNTFNDPNNSVITITPASVQNIDILLEKAHGAIHGRVTSSVMGEPIEGAVVFSYDATGHITSAAMSGIDLITNMPFADAAEYTLGGLRTGSYTIRTFALYGIIDAFTSLNLDNLLGDTGLNLSDLGSIFDMLYLDEWYNNIPVALPNFNWTMVLNLINGIRYEQFALMPFYQIPPPSAALINVVDGGAVVDNVNFELGNLSLENLPVAVEEPVADAVPQEFQLQPSYPNPIQRSEFSRGMMIDYQVPVKTEMTISIFNLLGQKIATLVNGTVNPGTHQLRWQGLDDQGNLLATGIYFCVLKTETGIRQMQKMVVLK